ncbi:MAG TPA: hypothetical protein VNJ06_13355 [Gemmatimonadales bacterium]|nr:hypothetical protein [Gemmatimonadales bacterium]
MTIEPQYLLVGAVFAVMGSAALVSRARERRRRDSYAEYSLIRGFKYEPQRPEGERRFRDAFEPFRQGGSDSWRNTITGTKNQAPFTAFEYVWVTGGGRSRQTHHVSGIIWESDDVSFPKFALAPEGLLSRVGQFFGMQDIDFADSPEFSRAYRLSGPNESAIRELFTTEIRQFFAATPGYRVSGAGRFLIWWFDIRLPSVTHLDEWLEQGDHVRRRFFKA